MYNAVLCFYAINDLICSSNTFYKNYQHGFFLEHSTRISMWIMHNRA